MLQITRGEEQNMNSSNEYVPHVQPKRRVVSQMWLGQKLNSTQSGTGPSLAQEFRDVYWTFFRVVIQKLFVILLITTRTILTMTIR